MKKSKTPNSPVPAQPLKASTPTVAQKNTVSAAPALASSKSVQSLQPTEKISQKPAAAIVVKAAPATVKRVPAVVDVKLDVGFGNSIYLRGQGAGLTWDRGTPLTCVDGKTWRWSKELQGPVTFKVLINDQVWADGGDVTLAPGQRLELVPSF